MNVNDSKKVSLLILIQWPKVTGLPTVTMKKNYVNTGHDKNKRLTDTEETDKK